MKENKTKWLKKAFILNLVIAGCVLFATLLMVFRANSGVLSFSGIQVFRLFTVDSNILMGIAALVMACWEYQVIKGKKTEIPKGLYIFKMVATTGVGLTLLITLFYLLPLTYADSGLFGLFHYSNFFFHLVVPVTSIITFGYLEGTLEITLKQVTWSILPVFLYEVFYVVVTLLHTHDGVIEAGYDWYYFFFLGPLSILIIGPFVLLFAYGIACALWTRNKVTAKNQRDAWIKVQ